jgi:hypothetical protein
MCLITMGLMAALASGAVYVGLMVSKDGAGETPPEADARVPRRTMSPHQPASSILPGTPARRRAGSRVARARNCTLMGLRCGPFGEAGFGLKTKFFDLQRPVLSPVCAVRRSPLGHRILRRHPCPNHQRACVHSSSHRSPTMPFIRTCLGSLPPRLGAQRRSLLVKP